MAAHPENPPDKQKTSGRPTRYKTDIALAKENPGTWYRLDGEHHSGNITTLKGHGLKVKSQRGTEKHKHLLWICQPTPEQIAADEAAAAQAALVPVIVPAPTPVVVEPEDEEIAEEVTV